MCGMVPQEGLCVVISAEEFGLVQTKTKNCCCVNCSLDDDDEIVDEESNGEDEEEISQRGGKYLSKVSPTSKKITLKNLVQFYGAVDVPN